MIRKSVIPRSMWRQWPIKLETDFILKRKLQASLEGAGASLDSVVKAQVYLSDREDVPGFNEVWLSYFKSPPATTIVATAQPGFGINNLRIEINTISLADKGKTRREVIRGPETPAFDGYVSAVKAGDLLFLSGLMAVEGGRLIDEAHVDDAPTILRHSDQGRAALHHSAGGGRSAAPPAQPFAMPYASNNSILILPICRLRIEVWDEAMGHAPLPLSATEVPWLPIPGARVQVDLWVHVPC